MYCMIIVTPEAEPNASRAKRSKTDGEACPGADSGDGSSSRSTTQRPEKRSRTREHADPVVRFLNPSYASMIPMFREVPLLESEVDAIQALAEFMPGADARRIAVEGRSGGMHLQCVFAFPTASVAHTDIALDCVAHHFTEKEGIPYEFSFVTCAAESCTLPSWAPTFASRYSLQDMWGANKVAAMFFEPCVQHLLAYMCGLLVRGFSATQKRQMLQLPDDLDTRMSTKLKRDMPWSSRHTASAVGVGVGAGAGAGTGAGAGAGASA